MIDEDRRRLVGGSPEVEGAYVYVYKYLPPSLYIFFYVVGGVDVQVKHNESKDGRESRMMFGMHPPSTKKRERLRSSFGGAERRLISNHARRERHVTHVCARTAARDLCTRAQIHRHASHTSNTCALLIHTRLYFTIVPFRRHDVTHRSSICICTFRASAT